MFHAATFNAPSGGGPMARETEHCGQKQMRWAADFCRGLIPTVCANIYTATDLCPTSSSRLQRRQCRFSKGSPGGQFRPKEILSRPPRGRKYAEGFLRTRTQACPRLTDSPAAPGNQAVLYSEA